MELRKIDTLLFKTLYLTVAGIIVTQVFGVDSLTSALLLVTFPLTVLLWMRSVREKLTALDYLMLGTAMLALISVLLDAGIHDGLLSFSYIKKLIMFVMTLMFLQTANRMRVGQDLVRFINVLVDLLTVFLVVMYFLQPVQMQFVNGRVSRYLTFRFSNPNLTGLFLTCLYMLELYRLFTQEKWYWKLIHVAMAAFLAWFVFETESRNCLLVLGMYTLVCAYLVFHGRKRLSIGKGTAILVAVFPAIFLAVYMTLVSNQWLNEVFAFMVDVGKNLDSRVDIWKYALSYVADAVLIGAYWGISGGTGSAQVHNTHLDIVCSYGLPVLILVCVLLWNYLYQNGRQYADKESYTYILAFACALMLGMGEAALFSGGLGIYIFVGTFLLLANREQTHQISG